MEKQLLADGMGISLYQRYSSEESARVLKVHLATLNELRSQKKIAYLKLPLGNIEFLGEHLVDYIISISQPTITLEKSNKADDEILRFPEVNALTKLSRTTIWRYEQNGNFPSRILLGGGSVGWYKSQVQQWVATRPTSQTNAL